MKNFLWTAVKENHISPGCFDGTFAKELIGKLQVSIRDALKEVKEVTHVGLGSAEVFQVASNRRVYKKNGRMVAMRWSSCQDSLIRSLPEGLIDPEISLVSFWNHDTPLAVLSFYATHPQSYYLTKIANPDFPGIARFMRQLAVPNALHIHFNGAGGNISAGKYNDGSHENRLILALRMADGMERAWKATVKLFISPQKWFFVKFGADYPELERTTFCLSSSNPALPYISLFLFLICLHDPPQLHYSKGI